MIRSGIVRLAAQIGMWAALAAVAFVTLCPIEMRPQVGGLQTGHLTVFGVIGVLAGIAYPRRLGPLLCFIVLIAAGLELAQHLVPGRHGRLIDFVMKSIGGAAGLGAAGIVNLCLAPLGRSNTA